MIQRHVLRLVAPDASATAEREPAEAGQPTELRLRVMTLGEEAFGSDWREALARRRGEVSSYKSACSLLRRLAAERGGVGLVGLSARTESDLLESIASAEERVRERVILVAPAVSEDLTTRVLRAGAGDFVTAPTPAAVVIARLELRMLKSYGSAVRGADENELGADGVDAAQRVWLTPREEHLYALFARQFGSAVSREEILRVVWGRAPEGGNPSNIVDVYVRYLRVKLESAAPHLEIVTVREVGYLMRERVAGRAKLGRPRR